MANKESDFTTTLIASLRRAGVADIDKFPDAQIPPRNPVCPKCKAPLPSHRRYNRPRPCDLSGTLPGGRGLRVEVKVKQASLATGRPLGYNPNATRGTGRDLPQHQRDSLTATAATGGCAVIALVSWRSQMAGQRGFWRLYLWSWSEFMELTQACRNPILANEMYAQPYLERQTPTQLEPYWELDEKPKASEWLVNDRVREWSREYYQCQLCTYYERRDAMAAIRGGNCPHCGGSSVWRLYKAPR